MWRLAQRFILGNSKGQTNWKLHILSRNDTLLNQWHARIEDIFSSEMYCQGCCFYDVVHLFCYCKPLSVAKIWLVYISQHHWNADFQMQKVGSHPLKIRWIKNFCWIINRIISFYYNADGLVCVFLSLNVGHNYIVKFVDIPVSCRKCASIRQLIELPTICMNIEKYFINELFFCDINLPN